MKDSRAWFWTEERVRLVEAWVPMSIENIIDAGLATPEILAEYDAMRAACLARWKALPWRVRAWRTILIWAGRHGWRA